jgi:hypothetical protein
MNSQLFEQMSSLAYSGFSSNTIKENINLIEGYTYFSQNNNNSGNIYLNGNIDSYNTLRTKLSNDPKYDFNGNILLFNDENILISEQVKKDNEMLIASENNLIIASAIAGVTMLIVAGFIIVSKK